jgi:phosphate-selective porin OprO/OprP
MFLFAVAVAASPCHAAVDLHERFVEKGIITEEERQELAKEDEVKVIHKKSFTWMTADERFSLQLYGYGQVRSTYQNRNNGADDRFNFSVQRARIGVRGYAFQKDLKYQLYLNVYQGDEEDTSLLDYFFDYAPIPELGVKGGQFKVPYAVQWNISAAGLQLVDRTTVDGNFRLDRDSGVSLHGKLASMLRYDVGVFNGEGRNRNNPDDNLLYVARLMLEPLGKYPFHESDNELSKKPVLLLVAGMAYDDDVSSHTRNNLNSWLNTLGKSNVLSYDGFAGFKYRGASAQGEVHRRNIDPGSNDVTAVGFYAQGGYFVWRDKVEAAARYEYFDPDDDEGSDVRTEYGGGVNYFFAGHRNKAQADFFHVDDQAGSDEDRLRIQYQLAF